MRYLSLLTLLPFLSAASYAGFVEKTVEYTDGETDYSGVLVYDDAIEAPVPGVLMVPNWMGVTEHAIEKAKKVADDDYVVFVADMYGVGIRPKDATEAGQAATFVRNDRPLMRARADLAMKTFLDQEAPLDSDHIAAIGFCFGGGTVLEYARSGVEIDAVVTFHADLMSPTLMTDSSAVKTKLLVLHGAADPFVPQSDVQAFVSAMLSTEVDWRLVQYSNTVHSFTDTSANIPGKADYNPLSSERAFEAMDDFFEELWD